jgi:hypothetical protein
LCVCLASFCDRRQITDYTLIARLVFSWVWVTWSLAHTLAIKVRATQDCKTRRILIYALLADLRQIASRVLRGEDELNALGAKNSKDVEK